MIQRVQSLYLLGVFICSGLLFFTGIASVATSVHLYNFSIWGLIDVTNGMHQKVVNTSVLLISNSIIAALSLFIILRYKNRTHQIRLVRFCLLLLVAFAAALFFYFENSLSQIVELDNVENQNAKNVSYALGSVLPLIAIVFAILAISSIKKDEKLVRSADRIR